MAARMGMTAETILGAADWSSESVFQRFYYRQFHNSDFGRAVLSSSASAEATKDTIDM